MSEVKRLGRKGRGDVKLTTDSGTVVYLTAYEVRQAYRALYAERSTKRKPVEPEPAESEIDRVHQGRVPA